VRTSVPVNMQLATSSAKMKRLTDATLYAVTGCSHKGVSRSDKPLNLDLLKKDEYTIYIYTTFCSVSRFRVSRERS
jgi:hypothetical protein